MQDKEFDGLFRSKLDNFEAAPSARVWEGITEELNGNRRSRKLIPYLSIAASIIVLAAAGVIFIPKNKGNINHQHKNTIAKQAQPVKVQPGKTVVPEIKPAEVLKQKASVSNIARVKPAKVEHNIPAKTIEPVIIQENPVNSQEQPVIAAVQEKHDIITPVVPDNSTPLAIKQTPDEAGSFSAKPLTAAVVLPANKADSLTAKPKRKVRGLGGLLNTLIAKVDKRKDKIIEFGYDEDERESSITGVNLGVIKFKKGENQESRVRNQDVAK